MSKIVQDANRPRRIRVTKADVEGATPGSECDCAIARAIRRQWRSEGVLAASVGNGVVAIAYKSRFVRYMLSDNSRAIVKTFDKSSIFPEGFTVDLLPPPLHRRIGARAGEASHGRKNTVPKKKTEPNTYRALSTRHVKLPRNLP